MNSINSVKIVEAFWTAVWKGRDPEAIDSFVVDDFVITTGGVDLVTKDKFKTWARQFLEKINDFEFEVIESFQNADGSRVASRWRVTGKKQWPLWHHSRSETDILHRYGDLGGARRWEARS